MFYDRKQAGQKLGQTLKSKFLNLNSQNSIILALPRGGIIVAKEIAKILKIPLDIIIVKKIGHPQNPEYAIGAIGESGQLVISKWELGTSKESKEYLKKATQQAKEEIKRRLIKYRGTNPRLNIKNKTVILVDDGLATGLSMRAAIQEVKKQSPKEIIIVLPVAPKENINQFKKDIKVVCLESPINFQAVGEFYTNFEQVSDKQVIEALRVRDS